MNSTRTRVLVTIVLSIITATLVMWIGMKNREEQYKQMMNERTRLDAEYRKLHPDY